MNEFGKMIAAFFVGLIGLLGLAMSLCGGFFTFVALTSSGGESGAYTTLFLIISLPSMIIGAFIAWAIYRHFVKKSAAAAKPDPRGQE